MNLDDFKKSLNDLEKLVNEGKKNQNAVVVSQLKNVRTRISELENSLKNIGLLGKTSASLSDLENKSTAVDTDFALLLEILTQSGNQYSSISNVLKTKHDTAKNSVGNIR